MHPLSQQPDNQAAVTLARRLDTAGNRVISLVPLGYERYVRILNPIKVHVSSSDGLTL